MRKIIYILFAVLGMSLLAGCDDKEINDTPLAKQLVGEWKLTSWSSQASQAFDAYIDFAHETFVLYQKIESAQYQKYTGNYLLKGDVLSGKYSDNTLWGSSYTISIDESGNSLTMRSIADERDVSVYTRATIPDSVKEGATEMQDVRSASFRLL